MLINLGELHGRWCQLDGLKGGTVSLWWIMYVVDRKIAEES